VRTNKLRDSVIDPLRKLIKNLEGNA
jgi:hypothetical protein